MRNCDTQKSDYSDWRPMRIIVAAFAYQTVACFTEPPISLFDAVDVVACAIHHMNDVIDNYCRGCRRIKILRLNGRSRERVPKSCSRKTQEMQFGSIDFSLVHNVRRNCHTWHRQWDAKCHRERLLQMGVSASQQARGKL